jgi:phage-related minor tail protein
MTALGVFRDDFYNAVSVLPQSQINSSTQNGGTISATLLAGAGDVYASFSGQAGAQALTTDTAVNIIAQIQQAVATAYKQGLGTFAAGVNPPAGVPNLFNVVYTLTILNFNNTAGVITLTGGTGVTISGTNTLAINTERTFIVTVTSPTTVTMQSIYAGAITAA